MDTKLDIPSFTEPNKPKKLVIKKVVAKAEEPAYVALTDQDMKPVARAKTSLILQGTSKKLFVSRTNCKE